ncbi:T9SS type A sorting domain-containing protein [Labilibacter sediminis]|nr:T9SS type A sorting domain-containing protein [Labilibacter sediminis]
MKRIKERGYMWLFEKTKSRNMKRTFTFLILMGLLAIVNITKVNAQDVYTKLGHVGGGITEALDYANGNLYYNVGQKFIVTDQSNPQETNGLGEIILPKLIREILVIGDYAYVITSTDVGELYILNVSNPSNITIESTTNIGLMFVDFFDFVLVNMEIADGYAYINMMSNIIVIDINNKANPSIVQFFEDPNNSFDGGMAFKGNYMLASISDEFGLGKLAVYDITDKANISLVNDVDTIRGYGEDITINGNYAYVTEGDYGFSSHDISDITKPTQKDTSQYYGWYSDIEIANDYAYITLASGGMVVVDVIDPTSIPNMPDGEHFSPVEYSNTSAVAVNNSYAYLASGISGLEILDVSDSYFPNPITLEWIEGGGRSTDVVARDGMMYTSNGTAGLTIVNIEDPAVPKVITSVDVGFYCYTTVLDGDYAYVGHSKGISIVDISDPINASVVGEYIKDGNSNAVRGIEIKGNRAYIAMDGQGVVVLDISNKTTPSKVTYLKATYVLETDEFGTPTVTDNGYANDVIIIGDYLYVADRNIGTYSSSKGPISIWNISNPDNITHHKNLTYVSSKEKYHWVNRFQKKGDYLYVADDAGIYLLDVWDPADPIFEKELTAVEITDIAIVGDYLYAARSSKLLIFDISNPFTLAKKAEYPKMDYGYGVGAIDNLFFYADLDAGVHIVRNNLLPEPTTDVKENSIEGLNVYPNPFTSGFFVNAHATITNVEVYNVAGQKIQQEVVLNGNQVEVKSSDWNAGVYLITVTDNEGNVATIKMVKH